MDARRESCSRASAPGHGEADEVRDPRDPLRRRRGRRRPPSAPADADRAPDAAVDLDRSGETGADRDRRLVRWLVVARDVGGRAGAQSGGQRGRSAARSISAPIGRLGEPGGRTSCPPVAPVRSVPVARPHRSQRCSTSATRSGGGREDHPWLGLAGHERRERPQRLLLTGVDRKPRLILSTLRDVDRPERRDGSAARTESRASEVVTAPTDVPSART